jgi:phosphoribosylformylglycinamidine cyclo-ligase
MTTPKSAEYARSGVDIDAADELIRRIRPHADSTRIDGATAGLGGFGAVFDLAKAGYGAGAPRLVSGTDGVGTKLKLAFATGLHDTIGIDCVAMCVNDILAIGARPLFFLDYFATGRLAIGTGEAVVRGISEGCRQAGCWLAGGETAEMPGMYPDGEYDLAGFVVGAVTDADELLPEHTRDGDVLIGVPSSGLHSNGFSLARRVLLEKMALPLSDHLPGDEIPVGRRMLVPTRIYVELVARLRAACPGAIHGISHITGGGLWENPQRSLTKDLTAVLDIAELRAMRQPIFEFISRFGSVTESEMYRVFNMGVGLVLTVAAADADTVLTTLHGLGETDARVIGEVKTGRPTRVEIDGVLDTPIQ